MDDYEWTCPCCLETGTSPIVTLSCTHNFCQVCITKCKDHNEIKGQICPVCRSPNDWNEYQINSYLTLVSESKHQSEEDMIDVLIPKLKVVNVKESYETDEIFNANTNTLSSALRHAQERRVDIDKKKINLSIQHEKEKQQIEDNFDTAMKKLLLKKEKQLHKARERFDSSLTEYIVQEKNIDADIDVIDMNIKIRESLIKQPEDIFEQHKDLSDNTFKRLITNCYYPLNLSLSLFIESEKDITSIDENNIYCLTSNSYYINVWAFDRWDDKKINIKLDIKNPSFFRIKDLIIITGTIDTKFAIHILNKELKRLKKYIITNIDPKYFIKPCDENKIILFHESTILICDLEKSHSSLIGNEQMFDFQHCKVRALKISFDGFRYKITHAHLWSNKIYVVASPSNGNQDVLLKIVNLSDNSVTTYDFDNVTKIYMQYKCNGDVTIFIQYENKYYELLQDSVLDNVNFRSFNTLPIIDNIGNYIEIKNVTGVKKSDCKFTLIISDYQDTF